jgi:hypothetical protein
MATATLEGEVLEQLYLSTAELAAVCGVSVQRIRDWVTRGHISPVVWGSAGPGNGHLWTVRQALGLTLACHFYWETRGRSVPWDLLIEQYREVQSWSWSAVAQELQIRSDDWAREELAKYVPGSDATDDALDDVLRHPEEHADLARLLRRLVHLADVVRGKLAQRRRGTGRARYGRWRNKPERYAGTYPPGLDSGLAALPSRQTLMRERMRRVLRFVVQAKENTRGNQSPHIH